MPRILFVVSLVAGMLVPSMLAPARTISVPKVLAQSVTRSGPARVRPRFAPTHIAFSWSGPHGSHVLFETVPGSKTWTRAPEAHDLEHGERHYSGVVSVDRPGVVVWRPAGGAGRVTADFLNTIDGPRLTRRIPAVADAAARTPDIVTRAEWGADESLKRTSGSCARTFFPLQQLFVHHTAGSNYERNTNATMRAIYWYHTVRRGWCDVGYNFVLGWDGTILEGRWGRRYQPWETHSGEDRRGRVVTGAHTSGFNSGSAGISLMGNFSQASPPPAARRSLAELLAWEVDRHNLRARRTHTYRNPDTGLTRDLPYIAGHRQAGQTDCPGDHLFGALPAIRRDTKAVIGGGKPASKTDLDVVARRMDYGSTADFFGTLVDENGTGLAGRTVRIYRRHPLKPWRRVKTLETGLDGSFSFSLTPAKNASVLAVYHGDRQTWGSQSRSVRVRVRPVVSLAAEGAVPGLVGFSSGGNRVTLWGSVIPPHAGNLVEVRILSVGLDGETLVASPHVRLSDSGTYRYRFSVPEKGGTFRARTRFPADGDHARAHSPDVYFTAAG